MKKITIALFAILTSLNSFAQTIIKEIPSFDKIVVSPYINVDLVSGEKEQIIIEYANIESKDIHFNIEKSTLQLYLTDGNMSNINKSTKDWQRQDGWDKKYKHAKIKITVTYKNLEEIKVMGDQNVNAYNTLKSKNLKISLMGDNKAFFETIEVDNLSVNLFGDNVLEFKNGYAENQKFNVFGDNNIKAQNLAGSNVKAQLFGDNLLSVNASDNFKVNAFGDSSTKNYGSASTTKGLVIGDNNVN